MSLQDNPQAINEMGRGEFDLPKFVRDYKISVKPSYVFTNVTSEPKDIRRFLRFLKNAHGQAYVPGSSLKGALRTGLLELNASRFSNWTEFKDFSDNVRRYKSKDPHHDFLRPLHLSDSEGMSPQQTLELTEIKFFNLSIADQAGWKDFSSKQTKTDFQQAASVFVESLKIGTQVHIQVGLDELLLSESGRKAAELPQAGSLANYSTIAQVLNQHALRMATAEKAFFAQYGEKTVPAANFYKDLLSRITKSADDEFYVRMAWGSGWRGMTGNWLSGQELEKVRKKTNLGKKFCPVFPKSRRLAMQDGVPALPLGWIQVRPAERTLFRIIAGSSFPERESSSGTPTTPRSIPAPAPKQDPEAERMEAVATFKSSLPQPDALAGHIDSLLQTIRAKEDEQTRKLCCQALLELAQANKKKFKSAVKDQKAWAVKLTKLCSELGVAMI